MRIIVSIFLLLISFTAFSQPGGYTAGTQVSWNPNGRHMGYFVPSGWSSSVDYVIVWFSGDGETNNTNYQNNVMAKWANDAGTNWNGVITLPSGGGTKKLAIISINNTSGYWMPDYAADIATALAAMGVDTSAHDRMWIGGLSGGVGRGFGYLGNDQTHNSPYRRCFTTGFWTSGTTIDSTLANSTTLVKNYVWSGGTGDNGAQNFHTNMATLYGDLKGVKRLGQTTGGGHSATTWDDFMNISGTDSSTNRLIWALQVQATNITPIANAGADQNILLPATTATLNGSASVDPDGTIVTYAWTKLSGPTGGTITSPSSATTGITSLVQGVYTYRLTVTDDSSATATDDVVISVSPAQSTTRFYPRKDEAFTRNGRKTYDLERLIDGDTLTKIANTLTEEGFSAPWEGWMFFRNYYNGVNFDVWQTGGGGTLLLTLLTDDNDGKFIESNLALDTDDSLGTYTLTIGGFNVWTHVNLAAYSNIRAIRVRALTNSDKSSQNYEMRFYGDSVDVAPTIYRTPTIVPNPDPGKYYHGIGALDNVRMDLMRKMGWSQRIGYFGAIFDSAVHTNATPIGSPSLVYKLDNNGYNGFRTRVFDSALFYGIKTRVYIVGATTRNLSAGLSATYDYGNWSNANNYKNIEPGADSVSKTAWAGDARKWYMFAALYGTNTSADLTGYIIHGAPTTAGQGGLNELELSNEDSKDWNAGGVDVRIAHYQPAVIYTKMDTSYWKVKQADPNMKVVVPALTYLDTVFVKAMFLENLLRYGTTRKAPWDGFGFNLYVNSLYDAQNGDSADVAILPGRWRLIQRLQAFNVLMNKLFPNQSTYDITENSGGASNNIPESPHNVGVVSGKTDEQLMADNTFKMKKHFQIGGKGYLNTYYYYWYGHDGSYVFDWMSATNQGPGFVDTLRPVGKLLTQTTSVETNYTGWADMLTNGDSTGNYVSVQYAVSGTNKLYSLWKEVQAPTSSSITIDLGPGVTSATLKSTSYTSESTSNTPLTITGTSVTVTINETGQYIEATYGGTVILQRFGRYRFR